MVLNKLKLLAGRLKADSAGQDMIEYALMASTVVIAVAAVFPTQISPNISVVFSKISNTLGRI